MAKKTPASFQCKGLNVRRRSAPDTITNTKATVKATAQSIGWAHGSGRRLDHIHRHQYLNAYNPIVAYHPVDTTKTTTSMSTSHTTPIPNPSLDNQGHQLGFNTIDTTLTSLRARITMNSRTLEESPLLSPAIHTNKSDNGSLATSKTSKRLPISYALTALVPLLAPTALVFSYTKSHEPAQQADTRTLVLTYLFSGTIGIIIIGLIQSIIAYILSYALFGSEAPKWLEEVGNPEAKITDPHHRAVRREMSRRWQYWVFMFVFAFVMAGFGEEVLKYCAILAAKHWGQVHSPRDYISVAAASGVGFAAMENIGFTFAAWKNGQEMGMFTLTVVERLVFGFAGHAMTATLTGIGMMARDLRHESLTMLRIILVPILFHGAFDFTLFAGSAYDGNVGWVHPKKGVTLYVLVAFSIGYLVALTLVVRAQMVHYGLSF